MKKILAVLLITISLFSFSGCKIDVGAKEGVVYLTHSNKPPEVILRGEENIIIENSIFFEKLVKYIDGKTAQELSLCDCESIYVVEIGKYDFALHLNHILIYSPLGYNIKGVNITVVECTEQEMNELFEILESVK